MSRRLSLDPNALGNNVLMELSPNKTNRRGSNEKQRRKTTFATYATMFGKSDADQNDERDENNTQEGTFPQTRQARRMSGSSLVVRPRGGVLGGSLQENMTGEIGGAPSRSARKVNQRQFSQHAQQVIDPAPVLSFEGGGRASMIMMPDRRDFASYEGRANGIRKLVDFLATRGYPQAISKEDLMSPTVATFRDILVSIASLVDPYTTEDIAHKVKTKGQWEASACQFFKNIRYPWNLSPKQIASVGSANAWPKFLGALVWLVDLIEVGEFQVEASIFREDERKVQMDAVQHAYHKYMHGDDSALEQLLLKLRASADAQGMHLKRMVTEAEAKVNELKVHLNKMNGAATGDTTEDGHTSFTGNGSRFSVESLKLELENLRADIMKLTGAIEQWKKKIEVTKNSCQSEENELSSCHKELEELRVKRDAEQKKLDSQVLKNSDLSRIASERNRLEKSLEEVTKEKEEITGRVWSSNQRAEQLSEQLKSKIAEANARCLRLAQKSKEKMMFELDMKNVVGANQEVQMEQAHKFLGSQFQKFLELADEARKRSLELQDMSERNAEECAGIEMEIELRKKEVKRLDEKHREDSERMAAELDQIDRETRAAQKALDSALQSGSCLDEEEEVLHLKKELERQSAKFQQETLAFDTDVNEALRLMVDVKAKAEVVVSNTKMQVETWLNRSEMNLRSHAAAMSGRTGA